MVAKREKILWMLEEVEKMINSAKELEKEYVNQFQQVHQKYELSAYNLVHYRSLRMVDIRELQKKLGNMGLSRLAKAESHVMASMLSCKAILEGFLQEGRIELPHADLSIKQAQNLLKKNTETLLGNEIGDRRSRIMVTLPSEAAEDYELVHEMVVTGMNCARINCAHNDEEKWLRMIDHVHTANKQLGKNCKVAMDLAGPKIRTGSIEPGPEILKLIPDRNIMGQIIQPVRIWLGPQPHPEENVPHLPLSSEAINNLQLDDTLFFKDTRQKHRSMRIGAKEEDGCWTQLYDSAYFQTGLPLYRDEEYQEVLTTVERIPPSEQKIILSKGDILVITREQINGQPTNYNEEGNILSEAHISCTAPEIFDYVQLGEPILFDDGKIEGKIVKVTRDHIRVEVVNAKAKGSKLRADKGINLPRTKLQIKGLTEKDCRDLPFVAAYADVVNMSFVNTVEDVKELIEEIDKLGAKDRLGIILKIETQSGFNNLTDILLEAMQVHPVGVMIARGDLAIEIGWDHIARIQEEMLSICLAGHIPVIWATQVLESLAKKGIPSRAEITDAAMAQRAECVMLNKGPMILRAISLLDTILRGMQPYHEKNAPMLPALRRAD